MTFRRVRRPVALAAAAVLAAAAPAEGQVLVDAGQRGGGILRGRADGCYVITPAHVVEGALPRIAVYGTAGLQSRAEVARERIEPDLAILRLVSGGIRCDEWLPPADEEAVNPPTTGSLVLREEGGTRTIVPVDILHMDEQYTFIASPALAATMSGGLLVLNDAETGLLLTVDSGVGRVLQLDDVARLTASFFGDSPAPPSSQLDLGEAEALLARAVDARDGSVRGQVAALETLLAAGFEFNNVDWSGVSFRRARMGGGNFSTSRLHLVDLADAGGERADFSGSEMPFAVLDEGRFAEARFRAVLAPFLSARGTRFDGADLSEANLLGADLRGASFRNARLRGTAFVLADLRGADFQGADLAGASFFGAVLDSVSFLEATFENTGMYGSTAARFSLTPGQQAGACSRAIRLDATGGWLTVTLDERLGENPSEPGVWARHQTHYAVKVGPLPAASLPPCRTPASAARHAGVYNAQQFIYLDRAYLSRGTRWIDVQRRVRTHFDWLESTRAPDRLFRGTGAGGAPR